MIRPMASSVSALSGVVANGHQAARQLQRVPNLLRQSFRSMPPSVLRWFQRLRSTISWPLVLPSPHSYWLGNHRPTTPDPVGSVTKLQRSLNAAAWWRCLPCSGQAFTTKLS
jgi:hypothetical protein